MYTEESIEVFLKEQGRLYDEPVAETVEEAEEFLEDCMAVEVKNIKAAAFATTAVLVAAAGVAAAASATGVSAI